MKLSKYTFLFENKKDSECYIYNTLSNALIEIDRDSYDILSGYIGKNDDLESSISDSELLEMLKTNNIVTDSDKDDFLKYKAAMATMRSQRSSMHLTIAPTMDCCFHCHYCFEKYKTPSYMTPDVMDNIVKYVMDQQDLKYIHITWFGGEPLMAIPQMELFYEKISAAWGKTITSNIITTGYHIDEKTIEIIKKIGISKVQITLDGMKETHNKVKKLPSGEDVFEKVLRNIELLNDKAPEINIIIRVNLTHDNAHEYEQLLRLCLTRFKGRKNIGLAPAFVLDRGKSGSSMKKCLFQHEDRSKFILELASKGIDSPYVHYPSPFYNECAIRNNVAISFDPKGFAYKCWEMIGNQEYSIGQLDNNGKLVNINEKILNRQLYGADPIEDPICSKCKYLPICNGGCPIQRLENEFEGCNNCTCTPHKGFMEEFLKIHILRKKLLSAVNDNNTVNAK